MTVVCDSWSLASKEQGNSLSFLCLYLECSLCSPHADTHTHTLLTASLSSKQTLRKPSSVREPTASPRRAGERSRRGGLEREETRCGQREERGRGGVLIRQDPGSSPLLGKRPPTQRRIPTSSGGVARSEPTVASDLSPPQGWKGEGESFSTRIVSEAD